MLFQFFFFFNTELCPRVCESFSKPILNHLGVERHQSLFIFKVYDPTSHHNDRGLENGIWTLGNFGNLKVPFLFSPSDLHKDDDNVMTAPSWSKGWGRGLKNYLLSKEKQGSLS